MKVFHSHSALDRTLALRILDDFQKNGVEMWFDEKNLGQGFFWCMKFEKEWKPAILL